MRAEAAIAGILLTEMSIERRLLMVNLRRDVDEEVDINSTAVILVSWIMVVSCSSTQFLIRQYMRCVRKDCRGVGKGRGLDKYL